MIPLLLLILAQDLSQQGAQAMRENRYGDAVRAYRELVQQDPQTPQWRMNLGLALHSAGDAAGAVTAMQQYVKAMPAPAPAHWILGVNQLKLGQACAAADSLTAARRWRATPEITHALADALSACKRYPEAAIHYTALGRHRDAARAHWQAGEYSKARPLYARLATGTDPALHYEYGDTLLRIDTAAAALPHLEKAREIPAARAALAKAYIALERWSDAVPLLEEAARQDRTQWLPLSRAYQALGRTEDAARALADFKKR